MTTRIDPDGTGFDYPDHDTHYPKQHTNDVREGEGGDGKPGPASGETPPPPPPPPNTSGAPDAPIVSYGSPDFSLKLPTMGSFSCDWIIQQLQTTLANFSGQIADVMGDAQDKKRKSEELRTFMTAVRSLQGVGNDGASYDSTTPNTNQSKENEDAGNRIEAAKGLITDPTMLKKLDALKAAIFGGQNPSHISAESLQNELDWAKDQLTSLNSDNELTMMQTNELITNRAHSVSTATNEIATIHETMKSIISNMRA
jgi:hypothetical protein